MHRIITSCQSGNSCLTISYTHTLLCLCTKWYIYVSTQVKVRRMQFFAFFIEIWYNVMCGGSGTAAIGIYSEHLQWWFPLGDSRYIQAHLWCWTGKVTSLYSPPFFSSHTGYRMCLRAYLNGDGMGEKTHLALFLSSRRESLMICCLYIGWVGMQCGTYIQ